jgi:hypothetical protein
LECCCPWLSNNCVISSALTSSNPASCDILLTLSRGFTTGSYPMKLCINCGRRLCHTPFRHFTDTTSQAVLMLLIPFKMSDEHQ